ISEGDGSGISVKASENNIINDNYIWSNAGKGIEIYNSGNTTIINNYITLNMEGGIYLNMDSGNNTIEKNDLINNGYSGIFIYAGSGNSILSNTIGNTGDIRLPNSAGTEKKMPDIIARVFELQVPVLYSSEGIQLMGVTETEILSNTVNRCTNYGIRMDGIVVIDSSGGSLDTTFYVPEAIHIKSNFFEENGINDITLYNAHSAIIEENFMQYSGSGIYGRGLSKINPALVDRDSIDRGDFIIRDNIFSYIGHRDVRKISSIQRPADGAILLSDLQTAHIYNNKIMNSGGGMYLASITQAFVYSNNLNSLNYRGVDAYQIDSCVIHDNNLSNTVESGIYIYNYFDVNRGPDINYIDIYQNTISNIQGNAIGCDLVDHLAITKNTITNVEQVGISTSDCKESYIKNNTVSGCTAPSLLVQNTPLVNINLNQFINPSGLGMPSVQFAYLGKASISENLISDATENGIVSNYVDTLLLKENQIISCNGFGCNFGGSQLIQMIRNEIHGNINGAYFFESDSIILDANTISGNRMGGLDLNTNHYCLISNNYIMENKRNGIQVNVMDTCIVQNNYIADNGYGYMTSDPGGQKQLCNSQY
ncbi:MAG: right-handed parallel beta-helix repeat-containing protein, partial [Calditrichaceae bacterium]